MSGRKAEYLRLFLFQIERAGGGDAGKEKLY